MVFSKTQTGVLHFQSREHATWWLTDKLQQFRCEQMQHLAMVKCLVINNGFSLNTWLKGFTGLDLEHRLIPYFLSLTGKSGNVYVLAKRRCKRR